MSEVCSASIRIGGAVERSRIEPLLEVIRWMEFGPAWDEPFKSKDPDDLLDALTDGRLWLCNAEINFSALSKLEEVCQDLGLGYTQHVEAGIGDDASLTDWRPGMNQTLFRTGSNADGDATLVPKAEVREALTELEAGRVAEATEMLRRLCQNVPELPPFTIV